MALQEAFVFGRNAPLMNPCGVGFGAPCATRDADIRMWQRAIPTMREYLSHGSAIGILVQARNTRAWDDAARNYAFNYDEDYVVAAYGVGAALGRPWKPGMMIMEWLGLFVFGRKLGVEFAKTADLDQIFQCSPAGCNLSKKGSMSMVRFYSGKGDVQATAIAATMRDVMMPTKQGQAVERNTAGWIGGEFPPEKVSSGANLIGRDRLRAPNYQAPTPPARTPRE